MKLIFKQLIFSSIICFSVSESVFGQEKNILKYLDDGGTSKSTDILHFDISQLFSSNVMLFFEHRFTDDFSAQGGFGLVLYEQYKPLFKPLFRPDRLCPDLNNGMMFCVKPIIFNFGFNSMFVALPFKYQLHPGQAAASDIGLTLGRRWHKRRHFCYEIEFGISLLNEKSLDGMSYIYDKSITEDWGEANRGSRILFPLSFKTGYVF